MCQPTLRAATLLFASAGVFYAQTDPGPRQGAHPGPPLAGMPLDGLSPQESAAFGSAAQIFQEVEGVANGLGPRFNLDSCAGCHAYPTAGGASPLVNPQFAAAVKNGGHNQVPTFLETNGPVRVVRFRQLPNGGGPDGGVHNLFTIAGRSDAPAACSIAQPDFSDANNIVFRIPTLTYGLGLIESITDSTLRANVAATAALRQALGIRGTFNTSGNDGTITRFGWKAQNKSLLMFSGEAYNVEEGVTNELFPTEREENPDCAANALPEDHPGPSASAPSDVEQFSAFMRFLAPPRPSQSNQSTANGAATFNAIGCNACHTASLQTGNAISAALRNQTVRLYSDLALHNMGQGLADGITQGGARGGDWRTAPLWGLGDKLYLLHDGRAKDLLQAIEQHDSPGSEAHQVVQNYQGLTAQQKQDVLNFLRSL